jgi:hypothetical protein
MPGMMFLLYIILSGQSLTPDMPLSHNMDSQSDFGVVFYNAYSVSTEVI